MARNLTPEDVSLALQRTNGVQAAAAVLLGVHRNTIQNYLKKYPEVKAEYEAQRETLVDLAEQKLFQKVKDGDWNAIRFVLATLGKNRGYAERSEVTGADGRPLGGDMSPGQRAERLEALLQLAMKRQKELSVNDNT
jgi:hypothetical protein